MKGQIAYMKHQKQTRMAAAIILLVSYLISLSGCVFDPVEAPENAAVPSTTLAEELMQNINPSTVDTEPSAAATVPVTEPTVPAVTAPTEPDTSAVEPEATTPQPTVAPTLPKEPESTKSTEPKEPETTQAPEDTNSTCPHYSFTHTQTVPTCTQEGILTKICDFCGYSYVSEVTAAAGHSWSSWEDVIPQTATVAGTRMRTCRICGLSETEEYHSCSCSKVITKEATCSEDGSFDMTCNICAQVIWSDIIYALGHDWVNVPAVTYWHEWAICPYCNVYLCELDGSCDPNDVLWEHVQESGGDWWNHSWANDCELIIVEPSKIRCVRCDLIRYHDSDPEP
jgi:hypothetical protein